MVKVVGNIAYLGLAVKHVANEVRYTSLASGKIDFTRQDKAPAPGKYF
jgi:hypothetical protein